MNDEERATSQWMEDQLKITNESIIAFIAENGELLQTIESFVLGKLSVGDFRAVNHFRHVIVRMICGHLANLNTSLKQSEHTH